VPHDTRMVPSSAATSVRAAATDRPFATPPLFLLRSAHTLNVALQPIVDIASGRLLGCESLLRDHDKLEFDRIEHVFDQAASLGVMAALDEILLSKALNKLAARRDLGMPMLFFNLDGRALCEAACSIKALESALARHKVCPQDLCIELSETNQALCDPRHNDGVTKLKRAGFRIAMDDFGCGYSGLRMLYQTAPDFIKIDRFFVQNLNQDGKKRLFIQALTDMAHRLGIKVIAEGVETAHEHHFARDIGCDYVQGYFCGRPHIDVVAIEPISTAIVNNPDRRRRGFGARRFSADCEPADTCEAVGTSDAHIAGHHAEPYVTIEPGASLEALFAVLESNPTQSIVPVVDRRGLPVGAVFEARVKSIMYSDFGRDLLRNPSNEATLSSYIRPMLTVDVAANAADFLKLDFNDIRDGVVVTREGRYAGYLQPSAIFALTHAHQLDEMRHQNPLTGLPGNGPIKDFMTAAERNTGVPRLYAYLDFDNFKPFNDAYGFRQGDRAILLMGDLLKRQYGGDGFFIGHVGGDDFFIGATGPATLRVVDTLPALLDTFRVSVASFYRTEDRARGTMPGYTRDGTASSFPLMTCSAGLLERQAGEPALSPDDLGERLALVKQQAKSAAKQRSPIPALG